MFVLSEYLEVKVHGEASIVKMYHSFSPHTHVCNRTVTTLIHSKNPLKFLVTSPSNSNFGSNKHRKSWSIKRSLRVFMENISARSLCIIWNGTNILPQHAVTSAKVQLAALAASHLWRWYARYFCGSIMYFLSFCLDNQRTSRCLCYSSILYSVNCVG